VVVIVIASFIVAASSVAGHSDCFFASGPFSQQLASPFWVCEVTEILPDFHAADGAKKDVTKIAEQQERPKVKRDKEPSEYRGK
jgi:hypothetical protein